MSPVRRSEKNSKDRFCRRKWRAASARRLYFRRDFVRPDPESRQRVRTECARDGDVGRVTARAMSTRRFVGVVARIERVPAAVEEDSNTRRSPSVPRTPAHDVAEVARAVPRGNVQTTAESDREVGVVATDAGPVVVALECRPGHACVLVAERDVAMNVVADRLNAIPPVGALPNRVQAISTADRFRSSDFQAGRAASLPAGLAPQSGVRAVRRRPACRCRSRLHPPRCAYAPAAPRCACTSCRSCRDTRSSAAAGRSLDRRDRPDRRRA